MNQIGTVISYLGYHFRVKKAAAPVKAVDETTFVHCRAGDGIIREEVWQDEKGNIAKYNLAFINHALCKVDHGRVPGYDNNHGVHHPHFMGRTSGYSFGGYERLLTEFMDEVAELRKK